MLVVEWELGKPDGVSVLLADAAIYSILHIPEHEMLVVGLSHGGIQFFDLHNRYVAKAVKFHKDGIFDIQLTPDKQSVMISSADGAISRWDLKTLEHTHWQQLSTKSVRTMTYSPDGEHLLVGSSDNSIRILDKDLKQVKQLEKHYLSVFRIAFSPDNGMLYSVGRDAHLRIWDPKRDYEEVEAIPAHMYAINDLIFLPNNLMATGSMDKSIKIWDQNTFELTSVVRPEQGGCHKNGVNRLVRIGDKLLSCGDDKLIMEWTVTTEA